MKSITIIFLGILILTGIPLVLGQGNITNLVVDQPLADFTAGETVSTIFSFDYPDFSYYYLNQRQGAPLVFIVNISSDEIGYPVWKGDFEAGGVMNSFRDFDCVEGDQVIDYPDGPVEINGVSNGTFYCTSDDFLAMDLGSHNEMVLKIKSNPALWPGNYSFSVGFFYPENITAKIINWIIYSPLADEVYDSKKVLFNMTLNKNVDRISYINWNDKIKRWRRLCYNCDEYGFSRKKNKVLREGDNNISFRAIDYFGNVGMINMSIFVDSKKPKIYKTEPVNSKNIADGNFYIRYTETNVRNVTLYYGIWNDMQRVTRMDCPSGRNKKCYFTVDIGDYDGRYIDFWFEFSDVVNIVQSRVNRVMVDTTFPVLKLNMLENVTYEKRVPFNITTTEEVKLQYFDKSSNKPRWRTLCTRCDEYGFSKKKSKIFKKGIHKISIRALDKAGNSDISDVEFNVI